MISPLRTGLVPIALALVLAVSPGSTGTAAAQRTPPSPADTSATLPESTVSARGALLRSFAIPGWGQSYAGAPGRGAIYFAMDAGSLWMVYKTQRQLAASRARDRWLRETGALEADAISPLTRARSQQFEDWVTLAIFVALFSGADAYVTAQLSDFVDQVRVGPAPDGSVRFQAGIPVGAIR